MRIVHFSDIHLRNDNIDELENYFRVALISKLRELDSYREIDLVLITGDLLDKGGGSLNKFFIKEEVNSHYELFEKKFIDPISKGLKISKNNFLFIPGNHDVDESKIEWIKEKEMVKEKIRFVIDKHDGRDFLEENLGSYKNSERIKAIKEFESKYHKENQQMGRYQFTENQSTFVYQCPQTNATVGFIMVNDSWLCKSTDFKGECSRIYFGAQQLDLGLNSLEEKLTNFNFCLMHHSIHDYMEEEYVKRFFLRRNVSVIFNGHYHEQNFENLSNEDGNYVVFKVGAGLLRPNEKANNFKPGFQVIDFDLAVGTITDFQYFLYDYANARFDKILTSLSLSKPIKLKKNNANSIISSFQSLNIDDVNDFK
jgi:predicted phosphodiesterase